MPRRNPLALNPDYNAVLVKTPGHDAVGALSRLYEYPDIDTAGQKRTRLAARVLWQPGARLPEYLDAEYLRTVEENRSLARVRRLRTATRPPVQLPVMPADSALRPPLDLMPPGPSDFAAMGAKAMRARRSGGKRPADRRRSRIKGRPSQGEAGLRTENIKMVSLDAIQTNRSHQPREGLIEGNVQRIVATFEHDPKEFWELFQPPEVRPVSGGRYELIHGHHRFEAALRIRKRAAERGAANPFPRGIPVKVLNVTPERARQIADAANLSGAPMLPGEIAPLLKRWLEAGQTPEEIMAAMPGLATNGVKKGDIPTYALVADLPRPLIDALNNPALRTRYTLAHAMQFAAAQQKYRFAPDELQALFNRLFITDPKEVTPAALKNSLEFLGQNAAKFKKDSGGDQGGMFSMFGDADLGAPSGLMDAFAELTAKQTALEKSRASLARLRGQLQRADIPSLRDPKVRKRLIDEAEAEIARLQAEIMELKRGIWGGAAEGREFAGKRRKAANPLADWERLADDAEELLRNSRAMFYEGGLNMYSWLRAEAKRLWELLRAMRNTAPNPRDFPLGRGYDEVAYLEATEAYRETQDALAAWLERVAERRQQLWDEMQRPTPAASAGAAALRSDLRGQQLRLLNPRRRAARRPAWASGTLNYSAMTTIYPTPAQAQAVADALAAADADGWTYAVVPFGSGWAVEMRDEGGEVVARWSHNPRNRKPAGHQAGFDADGNLFQAPFVEQTILDDEPRKPQGRQLGLAFGADDYLGREARALTEEEERAANRGRLNATKVAQARLFNPRGQRFRQDPACPGCGDPLHIPPHATKLRCPACGGVVGVQR